MAAGRTPPISGFNLGYLLHALPMLTRPSEARARAFLAWETADTEPDETWQSLFALGTTVPDRKIVTGRRPNATELRMPTLVLPAENSRAHDAAKVAAWARRTLPNAEVQLLPGATHHSVPLTDPKQLDTYLLKFLA